MIVCTYLLGLAHVNSIFSNHYIILCIVKGKGISFVFQIVYGNGVSNELDASVLASMVDLWISSSASRKDFEIPRSTWIIHFLAALELFQ